MSDKLNKLLVVIFLTLLIWTWAFLSKAKEQSFTGSLAVSPGVDPGLLVTFTLDDNSAPLTEIPLTSLNFVGAPSELSDLQDLYTLPLDNPDKEQLDFYYDPAEHTEPTYTLDVLGYLQKNIKIQELALSLESCTPSKITVNIEQLVQKDLRVECVKEGNAPLKFSSDPAFVKVYVRKDYPVESATVVLSPQMIEMAQKQPIEATPYVDLGVADVKRKAANPVRITVQAQEQLASKPFQTPKPIGIIMASEIQSKYKVTILNEDEIRVSTNIFATNEAFKAYQETTYPLLIEIKESDIGNLSQVPPKKVIYNFPPEYVKSGEIRLDENRLPRFANIKVEPIQSSPAP